MERSGNFYKAIRLGYILISILIGCISYICQAKEIIFNDEPWLCIIYTEDVTGQYWQMMGPKRERFLWYETALISPQAEPYQMASHGVTLHRSGVDCDAIVVRYLYSGTLDTIRYTQFID